MPDKTLIIVIAAAAAVVILQLITTAGLVTRIRELRKSVSENALRSDQNMEFMRRSVEQQLDSLGDASSRELTEMRTVLDHRLDSIRGTFDERFTDMRTSVDGKLEAMRATVDEKLQKDLDEKLARSFESVRVSLQQVYRGLGEMQGLAQGVGDLKKVLSNVKTRGIVGEIQLGAIIEQILSKNQYCENINTVPGSSERVEFAIIMPGDGDREMFLPIDAKFPGDTYASLVQAYDSGDKNAIQEAKKALLSALKREAKDIHDKYIKTPYTTDFGVMFLPFEGLYAEAVNTGAMEALQREYKVMIAGPSTMAALLNSLQLGFRTIAIQKNAGEVWKILDNVKSEFDKFGATLDQVQARINQANDELDKLIGTRTRMIQKSLRDVQSADAESFGIYLPAGTGEKE